MSTHGIFDLCERLGLWRTPICLKCRARSYPSDLRAIDGLGGGLPLERLIDDTDDTKSLILDINTTRMRDRVASKQLPPSVYDSVLGCPCDCAFIPWRVTA